MPVSNIFPAQRARRRTGFTLIEMLVAITLGTSTMLTAVALVHRAFEHHSAVRQRVQQTHSLNRFVEHFRQDVHGALEARATTDGIELVSPDGSLITYASTDSVLTREHQHGEQLHRERVELSPATTASLQVEVDPPLVLLKVTREEHSSSPRQQVRHISVAVGRLTEKFGKPSLERAGTNSVEERL